MLKKVLSQEMIDKLGPDCHKLKTDIEVFNQ